MDLSKLSNQQLEEFTHGLYQSEKLLSQKILQFLLEWERRKLYSKYQYQSLYDYLLRQLKIPAPTCYRYTRALRLLVRFPEFSQELIKIPIDHLSRLEQHLRQQRIYKREEQLSLIKSFLNSEAPYFFEHIKKFDDQTMDFIRPTNHGKTRAHLTLERETVEKMQRLKNLLYQSGKGSFDQLLNFTFEQTLEKVDRLQQKSKRSFKHGEHSRAISQGLKTAVWQRAKGKCENCGSDFCLEIDHAIPYARGGTNDLWNLRLLCHNCNQREQREVFKEQHLTASSPKA